MPLASGRSPWTASQENTSDLPAEQAQSRTRQVDDGSLRAMREQKQPGGVSAASNKDDSKAQQKSNAEQAKQQPKEQKDDQKSQNPDDKLKQGDKKEVMKSELKDQAKSDDSQLTAQDNKGQQKEQDKAGQSKEQKGKTDEPEFSTLETRRKRIIRQRQEGGAVDFDTQPTDKVPLTNETYRDLERKSIFAKDKNDDALWGVDDREDQRGTFSGLRGFASQKWSDLTQGDKRQERGDWERQSNRDEFNRSFKRASSRDQFNEYDRFKADDSDWRTSIFSQNQNQQQRSLDDRQFQQRDDRFRSEEEDKGMWERMKEKGEELKEDAKEWVDDHLGNSKERSRSDFDDQRFDQRWSKRDDRRAFEEEGLWDRMKDKGEEWKEKVQDKGRDWKQQAQDKRRDARDWRDERSLRDERRFRDSEREFRGRDSRDLRDEERRFLEREEDKGMWERMKEKGEEWKEDAKEWVDDHLGSNKQESRRDFDRERFNRFNSSPSRNRIEEVEDINAGAPTQRASLQPVFEDWMQRGKESAREWKEDAKEKSREWKQDAKEKSREFKRRAEDKRDEWKSDAQDWRDSRKFRSEEEDKGMWERMKEKGEELKDDAKEWVDDHLGSNTKYNRADDRFISRARRDDVEDLSTGAPTQRASFQPAFEDWMRRQREEARDWEDMKQSGAMFREPEFRLKQSRIRMPERVDLTTDRLSSSPEEALTDHTDPFVEDGLIGLHEVEAADALDDARAQSGPLQFVRGKWFELTHDKQTVDRRNEERFRREAWRERRGDKFWKDENENLSSPVTPTRFRREFEQKQRDFGRERPTSPIMSNLSRENENRGWSSSSSWNQPNYNSRFEQAKFSRGFGGPTADFMSDDEYRAWDRYRIKLASAMNDRNQQVESDADLTNQYGNFDDDTDNRRSRKSGWFNFGKKDDKQDKRNRQQSNNQESTQPLDISSWFKSDEDKLKENGGALRWQDARETFRREK